MSEPQASPVLESPKARVLASWRLVGARQVPSRSAALPTHGAELLRTRRAPARPARPRSRSKSLGFSTLSFEFVHDRNLPHRTVPILDTLGHRHDQSGGSPTTRRSSRSRACVPQSRRRRLETWRSRKGSLPTRPRRSSGPLVWGGLRVATTVAHQPRVPLTAAVVPAGAGSDKLSRPYARHSTNAACSTKQIAQEGRQTDYATRDAIC